MTKASQTRVLRYTSIICRHDCIHAMVLGTVHGASVHVSVYDIKTYGIYQVSSVHT